MKAIAAEPDRGLFRGRGETDGIERLFAYQQINEYPLYVIFGIPKRGILASWRANLVDYLLFAVPASLGLFCMTLFAVRQLQQQKIASWRWRTTAQRLKREMNRRTRAEAELHQAQKMEALGQLTGGVAHDFNNLLTVLQGCLEMLSGRQRDDQLQARVEMALATVERGEKLTGQLLAFARRQPLTAARVERQCPAATECPNCWPRPSGATSDRKRSRARSVAGRCRRHPARARRDQSRDQRARRDAGRRGVAVADIQRRVCTGASPEDGLGEDGDFVGLEISDTGIGMPPEVAARAFEPFFTSKGPGKGTGLGLSIVYGFARQSGGSATIRSELGRGTAVTMLLPRSAERDASNEGGATDLPPGGAA